MLFFKPRWLVRHAVLVGAVTGCYFGARWQFGRAVSRHSVLNWSYTIEWCLFAGFALLCWGWYLRDEIRGPDQDAPQEPAPVYLPVATSVTDEEDPELAAYNRYLAGLNQKDNA